MAEIYKCKFTSVKRRELFLKCLDEQNFSQNFPLSKNSYQMQFDNILQCELRTLYEIIRQSLKSVCSILKHFYKLFHKFFLLSQIN